MLVTGLRYIDRVDLADWTNSIMQQMEAAKLALIEKMREVGKSTLKPKTVLHDQQSSSVTIFVYLILGLTVILLTVALFYMAQKGYFDQVLILLLF